MPGRAPDDDAGVVPIVWSAIPQCILSSVNVDASTQLMHLSLRVCSGAWVSRACWVCTTSWASGALA